MGTQERLQREVTVTVEKWRIFLLPAHCKRKMASQIKLWFLFGSVFALVSASASASSSAFQVARESGTIAEKIGWTDYLKSELSEWHDVPLNWEMNATVPAWVKGQFIRNGPARLDMGGEKYFTMYMDGWGKLHSFKLNGGKVLASGKFTETELYSKDKAAHEILPAITLAPVGPKDWTMMEMMQGLKNGFDNTNTHVWRYGSSTNKAEAQYVAITDYPTQTEFGVDSLDFKRAVVPAHSWGSCAHPLIEPGTENTINYQIKTDWLFRPNYFEVWRYTKLGEGQMVAKEDGLHPLLLPDGKLCHILFLSFGYGFYEYDCWWRSSLVVLDVGWYCANGHLCRQPQNWCHSTGDIDATIVLRASHQRLRGWSGSRGGFVSGRTRWPGTLYGARDHASSQTREWQGHQQTQKIRHQYGHEDDRHDHSAGSSDVSSCCPYSQLDHDF